MIEEYREHLPVSSSTPVVSLLEGGTPLIEARRLSEQVGAKVWLKVEGANPTGSFKDRGMTVAISKAVEEGAKAVVCGSTGKYFCFRGCLCGARRSRLRRAYPRRVHRFRQAGPGARARRKSRAGTGKFRPHAGARA